MTQERFEKVISEIDGQLYDKATAIVIGEKGALLKKPLAAVYCALVLDKYLRDFTEAVGEKTVRG